MRSPTNVKRGSNLAGRIAALSGFLPHSSERSAPFFKCLRKSATFQWTTECKEAFTRLKCLLSTPLVLSKPNVELPLIIYLAVTDIAVSSVLVQEVEGRQNIIYFVSRALQGAELRYQKIEKTMFALIVTVRQLCAYFQSCQVVVRTNLPLKQVLHKPDLAGRIVSWSVELTEYSVTYESRRAIKGQVLADFVAELTPVAAQEKEVL